MAKKTISQEEEVPFSPEITSKTPSHREFLATPALNPAFLEAVKNNSIVGKLHEIRQSAQIRLLASVDDAAYNLITLMRSPDDRIALEASKEILKLNRMYDTADESDKGKSASLTQEQLSAAVTGLISALGIASGDTEIRVNAEASLTNKLKSRLSSAFSSPEESLALADVIKPDAISKRISDSLEAAGIATEDETVSSLPIRSSLPVSDDILNKHVELSKSTPLYVHSIPDVDDSKLGELAESVSTQEPGIFRRSGTIPASKPKKKRGTP